jgi:hypothetical protein
MARARCEWYKSIDVRDWHRQGLLTPPGKAFVCNWTCDGESSGSISAVVRDGSVTLGYLRLGGGLQGPEKWALLLSSTPSDRGSNALQFW